MNMNASKKSFHPVRIAYNKFEPNGGADPNLSPLIYLHGLTAFKEDWGDIPQIVANVTRRNAYVTDARNHGDSEWTDYFNFDVNADDLIHFMDTVDISKAIIVGHSMGGVTAIKVALKRPDRIEGIVVEDMFVRKLPKQIMDIVLPYVRLCRSAIDVVPSDLDEDGAKRFIMQHIRSNMPPNFLGQEMPKQNKEQDNDAHFKIRRDADGYFIFAANLEVIERTMADPETISSDAQGVFEGPACFIYGKLSPMLVGADEHHIRQHFPKAVFVGVEETAHDVHNDKPLEFTDALLKFIS